MRFSLQDIRKSVQRREGVLTVSLHFLRPGELQDEILCLIMYYERLVGEPQRLFSSDEARALIGDYRMANCLIATLSHWYAWLPRSWNDVVAERFGNDQLLALASPVQLRLALYTFVQEHYAGFLSSEQRPTALQTFAALYHITPADLEYLLALDSEDETLLTRARDSAPTVEEVTALYNQWVFEAALFSASYVHFVVDCNAFSRASEDTPIGSILQGQGSSTGVGAVIKRLCFLARRMGVYYDLEYEKRTNVTDSLLLHLTLYGPQEVTGAPQQYGLRLARLCRTLLGYALTVSEHGNAGEGRIQRRSKKTLSGAIVSAEARVHFLQRTYLFMMDERLLQLLPVAPERQAATGQGLLRESGPGWDSATPLFDSSVEQSFFESFSALARTNGVDGWSLEREPEPLLLKDGIFIPDFALTRSTQRIYVEILGFWTPAYRERKLRRLQQLRERKDLLLAIPQDARDAFHAIAQDFPILYYKDQLSIAELLQLMRQRYDDFTERLAQLDLQQFGQSIVQRGLISEEECMRLLHCYRLSELQQVATMLTAPGTAESSSVSDISLTYVSGLGFYTQRWFRQCMQILLPQLHVERERSAAPLSLQTALSLLRSSDAALQHSADAALETLLEQYPELSIEHSSIFDATVTLQNEPQPVAVADTKKVSPAVRKKNSAEHGRRATSKKSEKRVQPQPEAVQEDLWGN